MAGDDPLSVLAEIRALLAARDEFTERIRQAPQPIAEFNALQDRIADCVPRLLAVVDKVLQLGRRRAARRPSPGRRADLVGPHPRSDPRGDHPRTE